MFMRKVKHSFVCLQRHLAIAWHPRQALGTPNIWESLGTATVGDPVENLEKIRIWGLSESEGPFLAIIRKTVETMSSIRIF